MNPQDKARVVIRLTDEFAKAVNKDGLPYTADARLQPLKDALADNKAELHNQLRDFEYYVESSEAHGANDFPMVNWTRDATKHPYTQQKYGQLFAVAVAGRKVFDRDFADSLAADLDSKLAGKGIVEKVKVDSMDPAKNPPIPKHYFK